MTSSIEDPVIFVSRYFMAGTPFVKSSPFVDLGCSDFGTSTDWHDDLVERDRWRTTELKYDSWQLPEARVSSY